METNLTVTQNLLAQGLVKVFQAFGIAPDEKLVGVLDYLVRTRGALGPDHADLRKADAIAARVDKETAQMVLTAFDIAGVPVCADTFVALDWISDQIKHKTLGVVPSIGPLAPTSNSVN